MKRAFIAGGLLCLLGSLLACEAMAAGTATVEPYQEYAKLIRVSEQVEPLTSELFGDSVNLYNGQTDFANVDIDIPGNGGLPVQLRRRFSVAPLPDNAIGIESFGGFGNWDVDVPHISGVFDAWYGWDKGSLGIFIARCSSAFMPATSSPLRLKDVFSGISVHLPGRGDRELMGLDSSLYPSDGVAHRWTTREMDAFTCTPSTKNGYPGEGFVMRTSDGVTYTFDVGVTRNPGSVSAGGTTRPRVKVYLLASRIEDRFGNWVAYSYDGSGKPLSITASDGRAITLSYTNGAISSASANGKQWTYEYQTYGTGGEAQQRLSTVHLPDSSAWSYTYDADLKVYYGGWDGNTGRTCADQAPVAAGNFKLHITHPSGALGEFGFVMQRHYRNGVSVRNCLPVTSGPNPGYYLAVSNYYDIYSLTSKVVWGAGVAAPMRWTYGYPDDVYSLISGTEPCGSCTNSKTVEVTQPDGSKLAYRFGVVFAVNDGRLLGTDTFAADGTKLRSETREYLSTADIAGQPFPAIYGFLIGADDPAAGQIRPQKSVVITENGDTFTHRVEAFNEWAQPTQVRRFSSLAGQQVLVENTSYINDRTHWLLGLVERKTNGVTGEIIARNVYDPATLLPVQRLEFERLAVSLAYNAQGLLTGVSDGNNRVTTLGNYKRGIPQLISYPDSTSQSAVVSDDGKIAQVVDQAGNTTLYGYDAVGRLTSAIYPSGDTVAWAPKTLTYEFVAASERGIGAGHWRRTVSKGDSREVTYFDVMLRPILHDIYMVSAPASHVSSRTDFDWQGKKTFESYPGMGALDLASLAKGTFSAFDALGRPVRNWQDSELGQTVTTITYLPGGGKRSIDARGRIVDTYYQMFDQPAYEVPVSVQAPEGISQYIDRDVYGNALAIAQGGSDVSLTRTLVYDAQKRLCRLSEPESGSRVMDYDAANNLLWSAAGLSIAGTGCGREQVAVAARTTRGYDAKNRLTSIQYPAGTESLGFTYTARGEPEKAISGATRWTFSHNKLGLLTSETLAIDGYEWTLGYVFDANASLSSILYPDGRQVDYAPDSLGRPTRVGGYAGSISYFPDGDVQAYVLGNGSQYLAQKNVRGLIGNFSYAKGSVLALSEDYTYDANANVTAINDLVGGQRSRSMSYDGLNRLSSASAPQLWGAESFGYDTLNNIRSMTLNGSVKTWQYSSNNLLTSVTSGPETIQSFGYDNRGNATSKNGVVLTFDQADRLMSIQGYANYNYDAAGRRVKKRNASNAPVYYAYSQSGQLMFEYDPAAAKTTDYIYLGKKLIAYSGLPTFRVAGQVEGIVVADPLANLRGWACLAGSNTSIQVQLYAGGEAGTYLGAFTANAASGSDIALRCRATGTAYRFDIALTEAMRIQHAAKTLYVYGLSASGDRALLAGSGNFPMPAWTLAPSPPARLDTVLASDFSALNVSWPLSLGAASYQLEQSFNGEGFAAVLNGAATGWTRSQPGDGRYAYRVRACSDKGCSLWTNSPAVTVAHLPATPASIQVPSSSNGSFTVQWSSAAYATSYVLELSINGGSWTQIYNGALTLYAASAGATGSYSYRAKSCNATACSGYVTSSGVVVTIPPGAAPTIAVSDGSLTGSYTVSWTGVGGAATYTTQEQVNAGGWTTVRADGATSWGTSGRGAATYGYRVQACNTGGCGPWSTTASLTVTLKPAVPNILGPADEITVKRPNVGFTIVWSSSQGATSYQYEVVGYTSGSVTGTSASIALISAGAYTYRVRACGAGGSCSNWNERWVTVHVQGEVDP